MPLTDAELAEAQLGLTVRFNVRLVAEVRELRVYRNEIAIAGVELEDPRIGYVSIQVDRELWLEAKKDAAQKGEPDA